MTETDKAGYESYKITIGSKSFEPTSAERISSINVSYKANKIPYAVINFIDGDPSKENFILSSSQDIEPGAIVTIEMGYQGDCQTVKCINFCRKVEYTSSEP